MSQTIDTLNTTATLKGEQVAFTGRLGSLSRREAEDLVRRRGGRFSSSVVKSTTLLVVGMRGWPLYPDGQLSYKLRRADALRKSGATQLRVCSEEHFLELAGQKPARPHTDKPMDASQVCELVGIAPDILHRWELLGLVRSVKGRYDFRDVVSLQTIAALRAQGVSSQTIADSVRALAKIVPGTDQPLAQLKLLADRDTLVAEINGCLMSPAGQLLMQFESDDDPRSETPEPLSLPCSSSHTDDQTAEEWFERGCEHEEAGEFAEAEHAYREALSRNHQSADANFNLANILRMTNRREAAEERYRVALELDGSMTQAWFNLADLLDDAGRCDQAIECLRQAVHCDPQYSDAHYNLATCCERAGFLDEARKHWREYVRLDPGSEWAAIARQKLSG